MGAVVLNALLAAGVGYFIGSVNTAILVGKLYGMDIRQHGSGNAGATNTLRVLGKFPALLVAIGDPLKGVVACLIGLALVGNVEGVGQLGVMTAGIAAVIGHNWPVYFGFKGGKGIFTSLAVVLMMDWKIGLLLLGVFAIIVAFTRYVSLGSVVGSALFPVVAALPPFRKPPAFICFAALLAALAVARHRPNIKRLIRGTESKLGAKKNK